MKKIVSVINDDPILKEKINNLDSMASELKERLSFLDKQKEKLVNSALERKKSIWEDIELYCKQANRLNEFDPKKHFLSYDPDLGILLYADASEDTSAMLKSALSNLFR